MIIDSHTHIFNDTTYNSYKAKSAGRVGKMLTIHFSDITTDGHPLKRSIQEVISFTDTKEDLFVVGSIHTQLDIAKQLIELEGYFQSGKIVGIKIYPGYEPFYPNDERIDHVARLCEKYNRPLIIHTGDVFDPDGTALLKYSHPTLVDDLAARHPNCKIVIAHFGFPNFLECANVISKNKNVYADLSGTIVNVGSEEKVNNLVGVYAEDLKHAFSYFPDVREKVMFGTDYSGEHLVLNQVDPYMELVRNVFSEDERSLVYSDLASKLFFS